MVFRAGPPVLPMDRPVLELEQLRLQYPSSNNWTLNGLDLRLEAGETLALVGSSGLSLIHI